MKWYLDENLSQEVAKQLRRHGVDVVSAHEVGREGLSDLEQLLWATQQGRILVTYDVAHYERLTRTWPTGETRPTVAWFHPRTVPQDNFGAQVRAILRADQAGPYHPGSFIHLRP